MIARTAQMATRYGRKTVVLADTFRPPDGGTEGQAATGVYNRISALRAIPTKLARAPYEPPMA